METKPLDNRDRAYVEALRKAAIDADDEWRSAYQVARYTTGKSVPVTARDLSRLAARGALERSWAKGKWWYRERVHNETTGA